MEFKFFIGIDVSKDTLDIGLLGAENSETINHQQVSNNDSGIAAMLRWLEKHNGFSIEDSLFCLEHTVCTITHCYNFLASKGQVYG